MKAVIIAAGMGSRLKHYSAEKPKCMLHVGAKPIIEHLFDALTSNNIHNIGIIKGHQKEKISYPQFHEFINTAYTENNILCSLMYAQDFLDDDIIISYSDIIYTKHIVEQLTASQADISIVVDKHWRPKYIGRDEHPESEAEKVHFDESKKAFKLGKNIEGIAENVGEFIGLLKLSPRGCQIFKDEFKKAKDKYSQKAFENAPLFEKAYLTDFLNYLISQGYTVECAFVEDGWREIDTEQDLKNAEVWMTQQEKTN